MEKQRAIKISQDALPALMALTCDCMSKQFRNDSVRNLSTLHSFAELFVNLLDPESIVTLLDFWNKDIPEDATWEIKAIMFETLYTLESSCNHDIACEFLSCVSKIISN